jgi:hypothetical protein
VKNRGNIRLTQCAPWRELLGLPPYSLPPSPPWSSAGVDGVAKLLPHTHTNHMRHRSARGAKLNLAAAIRIRGAQAMVLLEEVRSLLIASCFRFVSSLAPETSPSNVNKPSHYRYSTGISSSFNSWSTGDFMDLGGVELSPSMAHTGLTKGLSRQNVPL